MSHDMNGSAAFYSKVVGWSVVANAMNDSPYAILAAGDTTIGGVMPIPEDSARVGVRPAWMGYIGVDDVDAYADKVKAAGGAIHRPPTDIPNVGRFAVASDPTGAGFILFKGQSARARPRTTPSSRGMLAGGNCTRATERPRLRFTPACLVGRRARPSTWGRSASINCSTSKDKAPAAS